LPGFAGTIPSESQPITWLSLVVGAVGVLLDRGVRVMFVVAAFLGDTIFHVKIDVEVGKKLLHLQEDLNELVVGELLLATEDPDTRVARISTAIVVDRIGAVVSVDDSVDCHIKLTAHRIDRVALALFAAVPIPVSHFEI